MTQALELSRTEKAMKKLSPNDQDWTSRKRGMTDGVGALPEVCLPFWEKNPLTEAVGNSSGRLAAGAAQDRLCSRCARTGNRAVQTGEAVPQGSRMNKACAVYPGQN
jgi:hypothetical protein